MATERLPILDDDDKVPVALLPDVTTAPIATHTAASDPHGDRAFATSAVATHSAGTTGVHGISDTTQLETTSGSQAKATAAVGAAAALALVFGA